MSLDEKAEQAKEKADLIRTVADQMIDRCDWVLMKREINGETIELSAEQKQKLIQSYNTLKTQIQALVEALP